MSIGRCLADAPNVFRFDDNELSEVVPGQEGTLDEATAVRIARNCPNRAIIVEREDGSIVSLD